MKTLFLFESAAQFVPQITTWYLADLGRERVLPLKEGNNEGND